MSLHTYYCEHCDRSYITVAKHEVCPQCGKAKEVPPMLWCRPLMTVEYGEEWSESDIAHFYHDNPECDC